MRTGCLIMIINMVSFNIFLFEFKIWEKGNDLK